MSTLLQAIGTAIPPHRVGQMEHYSILEAANGLSRSEKLTLKMIYSRSGIDSRHSVIEEFGAGDKAENVLFHPSHNFQEASTAKRMQLYEQYAGNLCITAAKDCLAQLPKLPVTAITHLITFSCTGMSAPGIDIQLIEALGIDRSAERTSINFMGCYAGINAMKTAWHISRSIPDAVIMIAGAELCSLHYRRSNELNQVLGNALFSDGAAVAIISAQDYREDGQTSLSLDQFYAAYEQSAADEMVWRIGDFGFDLVLSTEVPNIVKNNVKALVDKLLEKAKLELNDIDYYALHPGGVKILEACEQALGITKEEDAVSYDVLRDYGNMSSVTILFVLQEYLRRLTANDTGKRLLACAFGPGITMESLIATVC